MSATVNPLRATITRFGFDATQALRLSYDLAILIADDGKISLITKKLDLAQRLKRGFGVDWYHPDAGPYQFNLKTNDLGSIKAKLKEFLAGLEIQESAFETHP